MNENQLGQLLQAINTLQDLGKVAYFNKGAYNSETTYEINDVITYQGSSYVSLDNNNQGNLPTNTTYWSIVALKGEKGDTGKPFVIEKTYSSVEDMVADYDNMNINDYVMISGNIEEEQNATLWTKTETPAPTYKWVYLADFSGASGITGQTPNIQIGNVTEGNEPAVTRRQGSSNENPILDFVLKTGATGATGATGNGISSVSKTSTSGLTDTYTIAYTNGNNTTFDVTNGKGISSIAKTGTSGLVDTYTITYNDGTTSTFTITNGEDGEVTQAQLDEVQAELDRYKTLANVLPKATGEGTEVTLNNCGASLLKMQPKGNTEQDSYTGINLLVFPYYETTKTINGITFTVKDDGTIHVQGTASARTEFLIRNRDINLNITEEETYTLATSGLGVVDSTLWLDTYGESGNFLGRWSLSSTTTYTSNTAQAKDIKPLLKISVENGTTVNTDVKVWLYKGTYDSSITYEPFVGGSPSPSPDYPQPVKVVTGDNTIKVTGKNLLDLSQCVNGYIRNDGTQGSGNTNLLSDYIKVNSGSNYIISLNTQFRNIGYAYFDENKIYISSGDNNNTNVVTQAIPNNVGYIRVWFNLDNSTALTPTNILQYQPMIKQGSTASDYEPYQKQSYPLNLGSIELCKIKTYQDYIYKNNGNWYKHSEIGKAVLDGSEDWNMPNSGNYFFYNNNIFPMSSSGSAIYPMYSTHFISNKFDLIYEGNIDYGIAFAYNFHRVAIRHKDITSKDDFKTWLSTHNTILYYVLETPTDAEITDTTLISQLNALNDTLSFDGQTNISSEYTSGNAPVIISAEAIAKFSS